MSHSEAERPRRLTFWGWLLLALLAGAGMLPFLYAGMYVGLTLVSDEAQSVMNQPPPPGSGLAGAGQGAVNGVAGFMLLGAGALVGVGTGGLVGIVTLLLAFRYGIVPRMRQVAWLSRPPRADNRVGETQINSGLSPRG